MCWLLIITGIANYRYYNWNVKRKLSGRICQSHGDYGLSKIHKPGKPTQRGKRCGERQHSLFTTSQLVDRWYKIHQNRLLVISDLVKHYLASEKQQTLPGQVKDKPVSKCVKYSYPLRPIDTSWPVGLGYQMNPTDATGSGSDSLICTCFIFENTKWPLPSVRPLPGTFYHTISFIGIISQRWHLWTSYF